MSYVYFVSYTEQDNQTGEETQKVVIITENPIKWLNKKRKESPGYTYTQNRYCRLKGRDETVNTFKELGAIQ